MPSPPALGRAVWEWRPWFRSAAAVFTLTPGETREREPHTDQCCAMPLSPRKRNAVCRGGRAHRSWRRPTGRHDRQWPLGQTTTRRLESPPHASARFKQLSGTVASAAVRASEGSWALPRGRQGLCRERHADVPHSKQASSFVVSASGCSLGTDRSPCRCSEGLGAGRVLHPVDGKRPSKGGEVYSPSIARVPARIVCLYTFILYRRIAGGGGCKSHDTHKRVGD